MQGKHFSVAYYTAGTLVADHVLCWTAPFDCQLVHVSAVGSNEGDGVLKIGPTADDDLYLSRFEVGDTFVPAVADQDDFEDDQFPHIDKGTVVKATLDFDGDAGTAVDDFTLVLTFTEG